MSDLVPFGESAMNALVSANDNGLSRDARRTARAISRSRSLAQVRMARVDDEVDISLAKMEAGSVSTAHAMQAVTRVALAQRQLEQQAPEASARLAMLADDHMAGMADVLSDLRRELRRR